MVQCDVCNKWLHYECVGVDDSINEQPWKCVPCGGEPYPVAGKESVNKPEAPSVEEVLTTLEQQQEREARMKEEFERLTNEYDAVKRLLESERSLNESRRKVAEEKQATAYERYQRTLENESRLSTNSSVKENVALGPNSQNTPESRSSHYTPIDPETRRRQKPEWLQPQPRSELSELAMLMKRAHIEDLPKFNGNAKDWPLFLAVFKRTTILASIDDVTNVGRLTKALEGEARELVLDQLTFGLSPKEIMSTLEKRYGKRDVVLRTLSTDLMNFPVISGLKDSLLQKFAVALRTYVAQLKALGLHRELKNNLLESLLLEKLTNVPAMYRKWTSKKRINEDLDIESFANFVMDEWEGLPPSFQAMEKRDNSSDQKKSRSVNVHAASESVKKESCFNCGGSHALVKCFKFQHLSVAERWNVVKKARACFACLASNQHRVNDCPVKIKCSEPGCEKRHHRLLHSGHNETLLPNTNNVAELSPSILNVNAGTFDPNQSTSQRTLSSSHQTHAGLAAAITAKVVAVRIFGADGVFVDDYAFLDDGSTVTMMEKRIAERLGLEGEKENLHLRWTKGITRVEDAERCDVTLSGVSGTGKFTLKDVYCVPDLDLAPVSQSGSELTKRYRHLRRLPLPNFENVKPGILIGLEHATFLGGRHVFEGKANEPLASRTKLGWIVYGRHEMETVVASSMSAGKQGFQQCHTRLAKRQDEADQQLHESVKKFFAVENVGVTAKPSKNAEDERAEKIMESTMQMVDGRYEVGLLWKTDDEQLPETKKMAMKRLLSEEKKLLKDPPSLEWMNQHVQKLVDKDYAREATDEDLKTVWKRKWFCPLFTVINRNKIPPKRRCVADVAATENGVSLNSCLLTGPDNLIALPAALCRARENPVMVTADVAELFHQIRIIKDDQQCQRFLWRNGNPSLQPKTFVMQSMMFGPMCSPSQAQHVKNHHVAKYREEYPEVTEALIRFMYMDDYFNSHETFAQAVKVTLQTVKICKEMGFDLVQLQSSHDEVLKLMPQRNGKQELVNLNVDESTTYTSKLLGMYWSTSEDAFVFKRNFNELLTRMVEEDYRPTKREVLSTLMKIFDPLGLIAKYVIRRKSLLQKIWREKIEWDERLPENLAEKWLSFLNSFDEIEKMKIPRWYGGAARDFSRTELVVLVDASDRAYAAVGYFRFSGGNDVRVALVMAKTKVAPVKTNGTIGNWGASFEFTQPAMKFLGSLMSRWEQVK